MAEWMILAAILAGPQLSHRNCPYCNWVSPRFSGEIEMHLSKEYQNIFLDELRIKGRYFIGDYSVEGHEDSVAVEQKEGRG